MANILIVDDVAFMRIYLKNVVEKAGHKVVGLAGDGIEAVRLYKALKPDIVTMDILMPGLDGMGALKAIRNEDPNAKVIMVTTIEQEQTREQARKFGAAGYTRKSSETGELVDEIKRVFVAK